MLMPFQLKLIEFMHRRGMTIDNNKMAVSIAFAARDKRLDKTPVLLKRKEIQN